jgi:hypothetical protein
VTIGQASILDDITIAERRVSQTGDSYARARQVPAVVQLHSYAGLANGFGMMYYARRGYTEASISGSVYLVSARSVVVLVSK